MKKTTGVAPRMFAIKLDLDEGQIIFEALAELPFKLVYVLIGKLNSRANEIAVGGATAEGQVYMLDEQDLKLIMHALGALPFNQVHDLMENLNQQVQALTEGVAASYGHI